MGELLKPGEPLDANTKAFMAALWLKTLMEIGEERFDVAFRRVVETSTFRPDIAEIRRAAGLRPDDEALKELRYLIALMRLHGAELKPIPGKKTEGVDAEGRYFETFASSVPVPPLGEKSEAALSELGCGSREGGLQLIACHPALPWNSAKVDYEDSTARSFKVKTVGEIEKRWINAWAGVR